MQTHPQDLLKLFDLPANCQFDELKRAYRELSFVWHPDRLPENLRERATRKLQKIIGAYEQLKDSVGTWSSAEHQDCSDTAHTQHEHHPQSGQLSHVECPHCKGRGEVAYGVDRNCHHLYSPCNVCDGQGFFVADTAHQCKACEGLGKNPKVSTKDIRQFVSDNMGDLDHLTPAQAKIRFRRLYIKTCQEHLTCRYCEGAGYDLYRKNRRHQSARSPLESERRCS